VGTDPIALEDAELAAHEAAHPQVSFHELPADVVDVAQLMAGLVDDLSVQELGQSHQDPGSFPTMRAQRASPRLQSQLGGRALQGHDRCHGLDLVPRHMHGIPRETGREPSEGSARAPGVAADEDLHHFRRVAVEAHDLEIVDLPAVPSVTVDELMVEDAHRDVDVGRLPHRGLIPGPHASRTAEGWPRPRSR
jgi:hypothetical protein